jgi:L-2-hydroxyglutarate oxidase LhgO
MNKSVIVVGAGVVGLACGKELSERGYEVFIAEQEKNIATQTSARNSGVIHAGIYYPTESLKAKLCIHGKQLLYKYCEQFEVPYSRTKKMIVATTSKETQILLKLKDTATKNGGELEFINGPDAIEKEPNLFAVSALVSPTTGIVDASGLAASFQHQAEINGASLALETNITKITQNSKILVSGTSGGEEFEAEFDFLINAAGHGAHELTQSYWPEAPPVPKNFAKGNYFSIAGKAPFQTLIYPVPGKESLGIHYTVDTDGRGQLGPNVQWVTQPTYEVDKNLEAEFRNAARTYWPGVDDRELIPGYSGIRPRVEAKDFVIHSKDKIITLLGIESPGLTSSLAIAELVSKNFDSNKINFSVN